MYQITTQTSPSTSTSSNHPTPTPTPSSSTTSTSSLLKRLWNSLIVHPSDKYMSDFQPIHPIWQTIGFQSPNPSLDLRAGGTLALSQLVYFAETYNHVCREFLMTSVPPHSSSKTIPPPKPPNRDAFPFALVSINVTYNLANLFNLTKPTFDHSSSHQSYWRLFKSTTHYNDLYVFMFKLTAQLWSESNATLMDFAEVMGNALESFHTLLNSGPSSILDLISWR